MTGPQARRIMWADRCMRAFTAFTLGGFICGACAVWAGPYKAQLCSLALTLVAVGTMSFTGYSVASGLIDLKAFCGAIQESHGWAHNKLRVALLGLLFLAWRIFTILFPAIIACFALWQAWRLQHGLAGP